MSERLGHVPIIDVNPCRGKSFKEERKARIWRTTGHVDPESVRFRIRSAVERTNARLKDEFGGRHVQIRGHRKAACHFMFGILALTVDQLTRLAVPQGGSDKTCRPFTALLKEDSLDKFALMYRKFLFCSQSFGRDTTHSRNQVSMYKGARAQLLDPNSPVPVARNFNKRCGCKVFLSAPPEHAVRRHRIPCDPVTRVCRDPGAFPTLNSACRSRSCISGACECGLVVL